MTELTGVELDRLAAYLRGSGERVDGPLVATVVAGGRSNLTYRVTDGVSAWALRRPPTGAVIESAHDVAREFRVVAGLAATDVPVARAVALDAEGEVLGAPAAIVDWLRGRTARSQDDVDGWTPADFAACADGLVAALVALHRVDPAAVGLADFGPPADHGGGHAARQLRRWWGQWQRMEAHDDRADRLHDLLASKVPGPSRARVVHGDYRVDNVLLDPDDPGRVVAVVDWELSTLGDPVADVATMCAYRHPALDGVLGTRAAWTSDGFPTPEELRMAYESTAGEELADFGFHLALAFFKLAVIAEGIAYRHRAGATSGEGYEGVTGSVPVLLEAGLEVAAHG